MINDIIDIVESLTLIMDEENARLIGSERHPEQREMVDAKLRLVAALEVRISQMSRVANDWLESLDGAMRVKLMHALDRLREVSDDNARLLARQIDLSTEMMGVVAAEAKRIAGTRGATYGAAGGMSRVDVATPISINTSL